MHAAMLTMMLAALALAGCVSDDQPMEAGSGQEQDAKDADHSVHAVAPAAQKLHEELPWDGTVAAAGPVFTADVDYATNGPRGGSFVVAPGVRAFTAVADGECASGPACVFKLYLLHEGEEMHVVKGVLPLALDVTDAAAGEWEAHLSIPSDGSVMLEASGTITVAEA